MKKVFCLKRVSVDYLPQGGTNVYYTFFSTFTFAMTSLDTHTQILSHDKGFDFISKVSVKKRSSGSGRGQTSLVSSYQLDNCHNPEQNRKRGAGRSQKVIFLWDPGLIIVIGVERAGATALDYHSMYSQHSMSS